jgi:hypothetical protein
MKPSGSAFFFFERLKGREGPEGWDDGGGVPASFGSFSSLTGFCGFMVVIFRLQSLPRVHAQHAEAVPGGAGGGVLLGVEGVAPSAACHAFRTCRVEHGAILAAAEANHPGARVLQVKLAQGIFDVAVTTYTHWREHRPRSGQFKLHHAGSDSEFQAAANRERLKQEGG